MHDLPSVASPPVQHTGLCLRAAWETTDGGWMSPRMRLRPLTTEQLARVREVVTRTVEGRLNVEDLELLRSLLPETEGEA